MLRMNMLIASHACVSLRELFTLPSTNAHSLRLTDFWHGVRITRDFFCKDEIKIECEGNKIVFTEPSVCQSRGGLCSQFTPKTSGVRLLHT